MTITIQSVVPVIIGITIFLVILFKWANTKLEAFDPLSKPTGVVLLCIMFVEFIDGMIEDIMGKRSVARLDHILVQLRFISYWLNGYHCWALTHQLPTGQ